MQGRCSSSDLAAVLQREQALVQLRVGGTALPVDADDAARARRAMPGAAYKPCISPNLAMPAAACNGAQGLLLFHYCASRPLLAASVRDS